MYSLDLLIVELVTRHVSFSAYVRAGAHLTAAAAVVI
jgi:hypothetical protein